MAAVAGATSSLIGPISYTTTTTTSRYTAEVKKNTLPCTVQDCIKVHYGYCRTFTRRNSTIQPPLKNYNTSWYNKGLLQVNYSFSSTSSGYISISYSTSRCHTAHNRPTNVHATGPFSCILYYRTISVHTTRLPPGTMQPQHLTRQLLVHLGNVQQD